jgi:hypothetical protein
MCTSGLLTLLAGPAHSQEARADRPVNTAMTFRPSFTRVDRDVDSLFTLILVGNHVAGPAGVDNDWQLRQNRNYLLPALEIVGFDVALNLFDRAVLGRRYYTDLATIRRNLRSNWEIDNDPFLVNQFGHPYQGAMYHTFARSAGLNYWESALYTFGGSAFWEVAGETTKPSWNDQLTTGIGGSFLGEALFRMASLVLENAGGPPNDAVERSAFALAPATGFNRKVFGRRFDDVLPSREAPYYRRLQAGAAWAFQEDPGTAGLLRPGEVLADLAIEYGMPGRTGYEWERPFDYFALEARASTAAGLESLLSRGLLLGRGYAVGEGLRGVAGLYGVYDYISPVSFRVSTTALSLGTTAQWWLGDRVAWQGTLLAGAGFTAVGTVSDAGDSDEYHYGLAPQALATSRVIFGDRASLDVSVREYYVSDVASADTEGHDLIDRWDAALTWRLGGQQAITLKYLRSGRDAFYPGVGHREQVRASFGVLVTFLGHDRMGAIDWRPDR